MKQILVQYADYNIWANNRIIETLLNLDAPAIDQEIASSFPSLRKTVLHTWAAEFIWLQRLQLAEHPRWMGDYEGAFDDICRQWQAASASLREFIHRQYDDKALTHVVQFYDRTKASRKMQVSEVLLHVFNHSTYHRGQAVTMLRQLGATKIPGTDLAAFAWGR